MTENRARRLTFLTLTSVIIGLATAQGQQGWSHRHTVEKDGKPVTLSAIFYDGDLVWTVGADGLIYRSDDFGDSFNEVNSKGAEGLNDVFALKDKVWMVGDAGTMLFSNDRGESFVKNLYTGHSRPSRSDSGSDSDNLDLYSVQFVDRDRGYIVGDQGLILLSTDGGVTWQKQESGTDAQLFHLSLKTKKKGWVVGTGGTILHTDDGKNWYPQRSGVTEDLNRVLMISEETGLITGNNGTLLRTENGGATWSKVPISTDKSLFGMAMVDKKTVWVVGYGGIVVRTYDGGNNWVEQESQTSSDLFAVSFHKHRGFAIGRDGLILRYFERR